MLESGSARAGEDSGEGGGEMEFGGSKPGYGGVICAEGSCILGRLVEGGTGTDKLPSCWQLRCVYGLRLPNQCTVMRWRTKATRLQGEPVPCSFVCGSQPTTRPLSLAVGSGQGRQFAGPGLDGHGGSGAGCSVGAGLSACCCHCCLRRAGAG
jgi:hypothetical protein